MDPSLPPEKSEALNLVASSMALLINFFTIKLRLIFFTIVSRSKLLIDFSSSSSLSFGVIDKNASLLVK